MKIKEQLTDEAKIEYLRKDLGERYKFSLPLSEEFEGEKKWCSRISTYPLFGEFASNDYLYWCFNYWNGEKIASLMIPGGNLFSPLAINRVKKVAAMLYEEKPIRKIIAWVKAL